jgi:eukaryotic-like serine/threonine-protein kinase
LIEIRRNPIAFGSSTPAERTGGTPAPATRLEQGRGENQHRFPVFLPDGRHFLYQSRGSTAEGRGVFLGVIGEPDGAAVRILPVDSNVVYVPAAGVGPGVLLYMANGRIEAQRFDPARRTLVDAAATRDRHGRPRHVVLPGADRGHVTRPRVFNASGARQMKVANADGGSPAVLHDRQEQQWPRISPDGTRMAWLVIDPVEPNAGV